MVIKYIDFIQTGTITDLGTSSTARSFPSGTFGAVPVMTANFLGITTSSSPIHVQANSTSSFTLFAQASGTAYWSALVTTQ